SARRRSRVKLTLTKVENVITGSDHGRSLHALIGRRHHCIDVVARHATVRCCADESWRFSGLGAGVTEGSGRREATHPATRAATRDRGAEERYCTTGCGIGDDYTIGCRTTGRTQHVAVAIWLIGRRSANTTETNGFDPGERQLYSRGVRPQVE